MFTTARTGAGEAAGRARPHNRRARACRPRAGAHHLRGQVWQAHAGRHSQEEQSHQAFERAAGHGALHDAGPGRILAGAQRSIQEGVGGEGRRETHQGDGHRHGTPQPGRPRAGRGVGAEPTIAEEVTPASAAGAKISFHVLLYLGEPLVQLKLVVVPGVDGEAPAYERTLDGSERLEHRFLAAALEARHAGPHGEDRVSRENQPVGLV